MITNKGRRMMSITGRSQRMLSDLSFPERIATKVVHEDRSKVHSRVWVRIIRDNSEMFPSLNTRLPNVL